MTFAAVLSLALASAGFVTVGEGAGAGAEPVGPHAPPPESPDTSLVLRVGNATGTSGGRVGLSVRLEAEGIPVDGLRGTLRFDPAALVLVGATGVADGVAAGPASTEGSVPFRRDPSDTLPPLGSGPLLELTFHVSGSPGLRTPVKVEVEEVTAVDGTDLRSGILLREGAVWIRSGDRTERVARLRHGG